MNDVNPHTADLLRSLFNKQRIGGRHTDETNVLRRLKHLPKEEQKSAINDWELCIKKGLVLCKKSTGELHVSLNPDMLVEIRRLIQENEDARNLK